jgi:hypothetical protein
MPGMFGRLSRVGGVVTLLSIGLAVAASPLPAALAAAPAAAIQARVSELYGKFPLSFEVNAGQVSPEVEFLCRSAGMTLFLSRGEAVLSLHGAAGARAAVRMEPVGAARHPRGIGLEPQIAKTSYFLGNDPRRWRTGIANFGQVRYPGVFPGVDMAYRGNPRRLEYDLVIAPGADPERIRFAFSGADSIRIDSDGELILHTAAGDLVQPAPTVYQEAGERRQPVAGRYVLVDPAGQREMSGKVHREVAFAVGRYDRARPLIIDPIIAYSTFLGGTGSAGDSATGIAVDGNGNAYLTGLTDSSDFPGTSGSPIQPAYGGGTIDAFVTKINAAGTTIVYSTFLGGSGSDAGLGIAVDGNGNAYVTGYTSSATSFPGVTGSSIQPTYGGGPANAFVVKLNAAGTAIVYSTFLGAAGTDAARGIAVDGSGNAYVTGETTSTSFPGVSGSSIQPTNGGGKDAFVTKINAAGTAILYSTFLGGTADDVVRGIAVDGSGNAYVAGVTSSTTFPGVGGGSIQPASGGGGDDAFVTKINAAGTAIVYSTFLGGSSLDEADAIAVDGAGNAYVAGATDSTTFPGVTASSIQPTNAGGGRDAFVTKINAAGTAIVYSTFLGGSSFDVANGIAVDRAGNAYVTGETGSNTFPGVSASSIQPTYGGGSLDAFVSKINAAGTAIVYSTFLGGSALDNAEAIAIDAVGNVYVTGETSSTTFPGVGGGSIQPANAGANAFVTKIAPSLAFYTLPPCRAVDTRNPVGPLAGPALQAGAVRTFVLAGVCGVPPSAITLSVNVTVTQAQAAGDLRLLPGDQLVLPLVSTINYSAAETRANNAIALLAADGSGGLKVRTDSAGSVEFILDVDGYFQ